MDIVKMNDTDHIIIQSVMRKGKNYHIKWLPNAVHKSFFLCVKSSFMEYETFRNQMIEHSQEKIYESNDLYFNKIVKGSFVEVSVDKVNRPIDIILLPIKDETLWLPETEKEFDEIKYKCRGTINFELQQNQTGGLSRMLSVLSAYAQYEMIFSCSSILLERDEVVAKYLVGDKEYPVTIGMLNKKIELQVKKNIIPEARIADKYKDKYIIREDS